MVVRASRVKFTPEQYHQMGESGILAPGDRVELIAGEIVRMSPIGRKHAACVDTLMELFVMALSAEVRVRVQNPVQLDDDSEPDLAILKQRADLYRNEHPQPEDILALVAVSASTLECDRTEKAPLYARAGIQELWIIDLNELTVEVCRSPSPDGYRDIQVLRKGQSLAFQACPDAVFPVEQLLVGFL